MFDKIGVTGVVKCGVVSLALVAAILACRALAKHGGRVRRGKRTHSRYPIAIPPPAELLPEVKTKHVKGLGFAEVSACFNAKKVNNAKVWACYVTPQVLTEYQKSGGDIARLALGKSGEGILFVATNNDNVIGEDMLLLLSYDHVEEDGKPFIEALVKEHGVMEVTA